MAELENRSHYQARGSYSPMKPSWPWMRLTDKTPIQAKEFLRSRRLLNQFLKIDGKIV